MMLSTAHDTNSVLRVSVSMPYVRYMRIAGTKSKLFAERIPTLPFNGYAG